MNDFKLRNGNGILCAKSCSRQDKQLNTYDYMADIPGHNDESDMVEVQFKNTRKGYYLNNTKIPLEKGDIVAVEANPGASPGHDIGTVTLTGRLVALQMRKASLKSNMEIKRIYRKAKPVDMDKYNEAKKKEKKYTSNTDAMDRVPKNLPALLYAEKVQKVAKRAGFDWSDYAPAAEKVKEELDEFLAADAAHMTEEGGDLLFAAVNLLRLKKVEAENALREASAKFFRRFGAVEEAVKARGKEMTELSLEELDKIWDEVKSSEKEVE